MMQDVISDYTHRTLTVEERPPKRGEHASVHLCQHGTVLRTIIGNLVREGEEKGPTVELYLFIF